MVTWSRKEPNHRKMEITLETGTDTGHMSQRSSSRWSNSQVRHHRSRPDSYMAIDDRSRGQSASPHPRSYDHHRAKSPAALRTEAVNRLREEGSIITFDGVVWGMPPDLTWNQPFLTESILLLPNARTTTRLRYWAICKPSMKTIPTVPSICLSLITMFILSI